MAEEWLQSNGYRYSVVNVLSDATAYDEMKRLSGQQRAPTLQVGDLLLPDFGPDELARFMQKNGIQPEAAAVPHGRD
jgi:glutaredoxin